MRLAALSVLRALGRAAVLLAVTAWRVAVSATRQRLAPPARRRAVLEEEYRRWARALLSLFGVRVRVSGRIEPATGARLVVSNHRSPVDIPLLVALLGGRVLSRADLARWPVLGRAARHAGTIFVDRSRSASGATAIRAIRRCLEAGESVIVFPEGGTWEGDAVRPFRSGALAAARDLDVEILPVGVAHERGSELSGESFGAHLMRVGRRRGSRVAVAVGEPVRSSPAALEPEALRSRVESLVREARREWAAWPAAGAED